MRIPAGPGGGCVPCSQRKPVSALDSHHICYCSSSQIVRVQVFSTAMDTWAAAGASGWAVILGRFFFTCVWQLTLLAPCLLALLCVQLRKSPPGPERDEHLRLNGVAPYIRLRGWPRGVTLACNLTSAWHWAGMVCQRRPTPLRCLFLLIHFLALVGTTNTESTGGISNHQSSFTRTLPPGNNSGRFANV